MIRTFTYIFLFSLIPFWLFSQTTYYTSSTPGSWTNATTWSLVCGGAGGAGVPTAIDDVVICGSSITMNAMGGVCLSLTMNGGNLNWTQARITTVGAGGLTMDPGSSITGTATGTLNVNGNFTTTAGVSAINIGENNFNVTGTATIIVGSTVNINDINGTKTFGNLVVNGTFNNGVVNAPITINGNLENNGAYTVGTGQVTFSGASDNTITGTALPDANYNFTSLNINKGTDTTSVLNVQSQITLTAGGLTLTNGTLELSNTSMPAITPFTADITGAPYLIPATAGLWCNGATINAGNMNWSVAGLLRISAGTVNLGTAPDNRFLAVNGGTTQLTIDGGTFNIAGRLSRAAGTDNIAFTMSGGILTVPTIGSTSTTIWPIMIDQAGSSFTMSNGTIIIQQRGGTAVENFGFLATAGSVGITGGVIQFGNGSTPAGQIMRMNTTFSIANLTVNGFNSPTCQLAVNNLTVLQSITINSGGTLDANNLNITLGNSWTNSGTFIYGTGTVTLNGTGTQTITNAAGEVFNNLTVDKVSGTASLANNAQVRNILTMTQGNIACGANTITLGVSTASTGTLTYSAGTIIGNFKRWKNSVAGSLLFPIGTTSYYRSVLVTFNAVVGGTLTANFVSSDPGNNGLVPPYLDDDGITSIQNQYTEGYWDLTAADGPLSSTDFNIECTGNGFISYSIGASTRLMYRPTSGSPWWPPLNGTHTAASGNTAKRNNVSGLSAQFAFGKPACSAFATASITTLTPDPICTPQLNVDYSVNANNPLNTYAWSLPLGGGTVDPPGTGASVTVDWTGAGGQYSVQVIETNDCGDPNSPVTLPVTVHPIATSAITGSISVAANELNVPYSVTNTSGYTYSWTVTGAGNTIDLPASGVNVNAITIDWGPTAGIYTVRVDVTPPCGAPDFQTLSVTVRGPIVSTATGGNWTFGSSWVGGNAPTSADYAEIVGGATVTINNNSAACYKLTIYGNANWDQPRTLTVGNGGVVITSSGNITGAGAGTLFVNGGGITGTGNSGIASATVNIIVQTTAGQNITSDGPLRFLTINANANNSGTIIIDNGGTLAGSATLTQSTASTLTMRGSTFTLTGLTATASGNTVEYGNNVAQTVRAGTYHHLKFSTSGASNTKTLGGIIAANGDLTITGVTLDASTTNYAVTVSGNWTNTGTYNPRFNTTTFNGGASQTITNAAGETFNNLNMSGAGSKILAGNVTINFDFTLNAPVDIGNNDMDIKGNFDNSGTYTASPLNDVTFSNSSIISGSSTTSFINIIVSGALTGHASNMNVSGNFANNGTFSHNNGTVTFNGTTTISGSSTTTFNGVTISGSLTGHTGTMNVNGNWTNNGTFTHNGGTVVFNGTSAQSIGGSSAETFRNLTISNASGVALTKTADLLGTLSLTSGAFNISGQTFTVVSNASGTGRVGPVSGGGSITGNFAMQRYFSAADGWRMLASPVGGATIEGWDDNMVTSGISGADYFPYSFTSLWTYNEATAGDKEQGWEAPASTAYSMSAGRGIFAFISDNLGAPVTKTLDQTGSLTSGSLVIPVSYTDDLGQPDSEDGWNLVGNPFPSDIDWSLVTLSANVTPWAYIWDENTSSYKTYNQAAPIGIASHQAFWVKTTTGSGTLTIDETDKFTGVTTFYKTVWYPHISMTLKGGVYASTAEVKLLSDATRNYDAYLDALMPKSMTSAAINLYTLSDDSTELSVNSLPDDTGYCYTVPVFISSGTPGTYQLDIETNLFNGNYSILLEDLVTGAITDLNSVKTISITISSSGTQKWFLLHLGAPLREQIDHPTCNGFADGKIVVAPPGAGPWKYTWQNSGTVIKTVYNSFNPDSLDAIPSGSYSLEVTSYNTACSLRTGIYSLIDPPPSVAMVSNFSIPSCYGTPDGAIELFVSGYSPPFSYLWSNGSTQSVVANLQAATYHVTVTDTKGCHATDSIRLVQPAEVTAFFVPSADTAYLSQGGEVTFNNLSSNAEIFSWDFGDGTPFETVSDPTHIFTDSGTFLVALSVQNSVCSSQSSQWITVLPDVIISVPENPASLQASVKTVSLLSSLKGTIALQFALKEISSTQIDLFNPAGQQVLTEFIPDLSDSKVMLNCKELAQGVYYLRIRTKNAVYLFKVIQ